MSWASKYIERLKTGETIQFKPHGNSMVPHIYSGQLVEVEPYKPDTEIGKGEIVLAKVSGSVYLHFVSAVRGNQVQISNASNHVNGWTTKSNIFGRLVKVIK